MSKENNEVKKVSHMQHASLRLGSALARGKPHMGLPFVQHGNDMESARKSTFITYNYIILLDHDAYSTNTSVLVDLKSSCVDTFRLEA